MFLQKSEKKLFFTWIILLIIFILVFASISFISYSYLTGFLVGSLIAFVNIVLNHLFVTGILSKTRSKKLGFWLIFIKSLINFILLIGLLIAIIFINLNFSKISPPFYGADGIFNVIAFIIGSQTLLLTFMIDYCLKFFDKKKKGVGFEIR